MSSATGWEIGRARSRWSCAACHSGEGGTRTDHSVGYHLRQTRALRLLLLAILELSLRLRLLALLPLLQMAVTSRSALPPQKDESRADVPARGRALLCVG